MNMFIIAWTTSDRILFAMQMIHLWISMVVRLCSVEIGVSWLPGPMTLLAALVIISYPTFKIQNMSSSATCFAQRTRHITRSWQSIVRNTFTKASTSEHSQYCFYSKIGGRAHVSESWWPCKYARVEYTVEFKRIVCGFLVALFSRVGEDGQYGPK